MPHFIYILTSSLWKSSEVRSLLFSGCAFCLFLCTAIEFFDNAEWGIHYISQLPEDKIFMMCIIWTSIQGCCFFFFLNLALLKPNKGNTIFYFNWKYMETHDFRKIILVKWWVPIINSWNTNPIPKKLGYCKNVYINRPEGFWKSFLTHIHSFEFSTKRYLMFKLMHFIFYTNSEFDTFNTFQKRWDRSQKRLRKWWNAQKTASGK